MKRKKNYPDNRTMQAWVYESHMAFMDSRAEMWRDCEMYDGLKAQWTQEDWDAALDAGIDPLTINRIFPTCNIILGTQSINKMDIRAKGRTSKDSETGMVMSEAVQFVMDQWGGEFLVSDAFKDQVVPGYGVLAPCFSQDPRKEKVKIAYRDWKEFWWDPFGSPWLDIERTRYCFFQRWMDVETLQSMFWEKKREIAEAYDEYAGTMRHEYGGYYLDEASLVEEERRMLSGGEWADARRRRVRPVQMWYTNYQPCWFATFPDGRAVELKDDIDPNELYQIINYAQEVLTAVVPKVRTSTFYGELELNHIDSPYPHNYYPFVPFVGYLDRFLYPYGVPRQLRGQNEEVNKRRSMALALLQKRRVLMEKSAVEGGDEAIQDIYNEANKMDGLLVVEDGKLDSIKIVENQELFQSQVHLMQQSENEIQQISGANAEMAGYKSQAQSGVQEEGRRQQGRVMTATLFENLRRSMVTLGYQTAALVQGTWKHPKMLRITDRLTGADRFVALNEIVVDEMGNTIEVRNDITQGKFDFVVFQTPATDTVREQYLNLLMETVKKTPPEVVPQLLAMGFELMDLPNKEQMLARIKPLLGVSPEDEDLSPQEVKQKVMQELKAQQQASAKQSEMQDKAIQLELEGKSLTNQETAAKIKEIEEEIKLKRAELVNKMVMERQQQAQEKKEKKPAGGEK